MLLIGILSLILISSNSKFSTKEYKNIIHISILIMLYMIVILNNSVSLILINNGILIFNNIFLLTSYNVIIKNLIILLTIIYFIVLYNYSNYYNKTRYIKEYIILILFNVLSICLFIDSINSLIIFITIELQSYSLYLITATYYKNEKSVAIYSSKNGLIYFLLGSLASILILFGLTIIYTDTGLINLIDINYYLNSLSAKGLPEGSLNINNNINITIGFILVFIGLFFKIGLAPLHNWLINIYTNVPTVVTLWISILPKISILTFILTLNNLFSNILIDNNFNIFMQIFIILSMIFGSLNGLVQFNIKRILAYSGLVNSGYILLAIWSNNQYSIFTYLFYIIQYSLTHFVIFMALIFIIMYYNNWLLFNRTTNNNSNIRYPSPLANLYLIDIINLLNYNKSLSIIFIICLTSFMGLPPLLGFYGKYYILITSLLSGYWFTSILLIIVSFITAYYYGYIIKMIFSNNNYINNNKLEDNNIYKLELINGNNSSYVYSYVISLLSIIILFPLLYLDIYQNGIIIINYFNII